MLIPVLNSLLLSQMMGVHIVKHHDLFSEGECLFFLSSFWLVLTMCCPTLGCCIFLTFADVLGEVGAGLGIDLSGLEPRIVPLSSTCHLPPRLALFCCWPKGIFHKIHHTLVKYKGIPLFHRIQAHSRGFCRTLGRYTFRQVPLY